MNTHMQLVGHKAKVKKTKKKPYHHNASQRKAGLRKGELVLIPPPTPKPKGSAKSTTRPGLKAAANAATFIRNS